MVWSMSWYGWDTEENKTGDWRRFPNICHCKYVSFHLLNTSDTNLYMFVKEMAYHVIECLI
jgi:hypothetical protein